MSKMKKKTNKPMRLSVLAASLMMLAPITHSADTDFSDKPLVGVSESFAPHVVLALSVEFPTAGAAYSAKSEFSFANNDHTQSYRGYFDNKKCYIYQDGAFVPSSLAVNSPTGGIGQCNNNRTDEFSGNLLNFMTMTAVDIFRSTMTGGNRAHVLNSTDTTQVAAHNEAYSKGDGDTATYLRRANVVPTQNGGAGNGMNKRTVKIGNYTAIAQRYLPHRLVIAPDDNTKSPAQLGYKAVGDTIGYYYITGFPNPTPSRVYIKGGTQRFSYLRGTETLAGANDEFAEPDVPKNDLTFANTGFGFTISGGQYKTWLNEDRTGVDDWHQKTTTELRLLYGPKDRTADVGTPKGNYATFSLSNYDDLTKRTRASYLAYNPKITKETFNAVVKVCDPKVGLENNCKQYGSNYKPEGLLQQYTREKDMRFATMGYLNIIGSARKTGEFPKFAYRNAVSGGVLRSRMKNLLNDTGEIDVERGTKDPERYGAEWSTTTGKFDPNPDKKDAIESGVSSSGTINYLNRFGDLSGYKGDDPSAELYYTALAYLRGSNTNSQNPFGSKLAPYQMKFNEVFAQGTKDEMRVDKAKAYDNFPVIYNWDDPLKRGVKEKEWQCHQNSIILIGDINTHDDYDLPNLVPENSESQIGYTASTMQFPDYAEAANKQSVINTAEYMKKIYADQNDTNMWDRNVGIKGSPIGMAAIAYWARVNDIRKDIKGIQNGNNFIIDVAENNKYTPSNNPYYLAAKFGGFTRTDTSHDGDTYAAANKETPASEWEKNSSGKVLIGSDGLLKQVLVDRRLSWTDDPVGYSTIPEFRAKVERVTGVQAVDGARDGGGTPRNYAVANNPDAMVEALEKAMKASGDMNNPTQAATGLSVNSGEALDFTGGKKPITLQSTYNFAELSGDVIAYETEYAPNADEGTLLKTTRKWGAAEKLNTTYRNDAYFARRLYTIRNGQIYDFNTTNASTIFSGVPITGTAQDLVKYVLGSSEQEGSTYRVRKSLMGTVINSAVMPIVKVTKAPANCTYTNDNAVRTRPTYYAAAANDGILHVMNDQGLPVFGYVAGTAIDKLNAFASRNYTHQYLNDGTPVIAEVCMAKSTTANPAAGNGKAKTVLLGTTGRGGASVYALDVTNLSSGSVTKDVVMWEFSDKDNRDLGLTVSTPVITSAPDGRPLAIVSSGYNNQSGKGSIFILDISKDKGTSWQEGVNYWQIELGTSGVGNPFVYDQDNDGVGDKIFVGDLDGKLWQIDRQADSDSGNWATAYGGAPLFTPEAGNARPITGAPYADTVAGKLMVVVGTGKYFATADLTATQQNYAYGFVVGKQAITEAELLQQQITKTPATGDNVKLNPDQVSVYTISENTMQPHHKGWRLELLPGQNIAADSLIRQKQAAEFTAARVTDESTEQCARDASTSYISVDAATGGLNRRPVFDTDGDGKIDANDARVGVYEMKGVATSQSRLITIKTDNGTFNVLRATSGNKTGDARINNFNAAKGVRRISWREIF